MASKKHPSVCLNMIVKNERKVIRRCLSSLKSIIDYWVIIDTGSTDGTQEIIRDFLKDIPGELVERPWVNFGHNRSEALQLAKGKADYLFIIDADEIIQLAPDFNWNELHLDSYLVAFKDNGMSYVRCQLVNNHLHWYYKGVLHEYIESKEAKSQGKYKGIQIVRHLDGARSSDPHKFKKDAQLLEKAILDEPTNDRYVFYLAQSYRDAGNIKQAIHYYKKRIKMGGWNQEIWYSIYQVAQLMEKRGDHWSQVMQVYLKAYQFRPSRIGPLFRLVRHYMYQGQQYHTAYIFGKQAMSLPVPQEALFIEQAVYDIFLPLEFAVCAFHVGKDTEAIQANNQILRRKEVHPDIILKVLNNRKYSLDRIFPKLPTTKETSNHIKVLIPFHNPGHFLAHNMERLLIQTHEPSTYLFLDNASTDKSHESIPIDQDNVHLIRKKIATSTGELLSIALSDYFEAGEIVMIHQGIDCLENEQTLANIDDYYRSHDCKLMYGQFRFSNGQVGRAMPLASLDDLEGAPFMPLACTFKIELFQELTQQMKGFSFLKDQQGQWLEGSLAYFALTKALISCAGYAQAHFSDTVLLNYNIARSPANTYPGTGQYMPQQIQSNTLSQVKTPTL